MSDASKAKEPLEDRAANWLNGVMYYGLVSVGTLVALWSFLGSFSEVKAIMAALAIPQLGDVPRVASGGFALVCVAMLLPHRRKRRATA
jgi:ABC-type transporter Mla MlaB component